MIRVSIEGFAMVMEVLGLVFGVIGAFVIFFGFMTKKNEGRYTGRLEKLYEFFNFRFYIIEGVLKFCYVLAACLCTGIGLFMALSVVELSRGLVLLVGGNLAARILFEFVMMLVKACRNLGEIGKEPSVSVYSKEEPEVIYEEAAVTQEKQPETEQPKEEPKEQIKTRAAMIKKKILIRKESAAAEEAFGKKETYKVCPSCGEKCSEKFAFCNMCGTKLS